MSSFPFTSIQDILKTTFKEIKCDETFKVYPIWSRWKEIVGETIAAKTEPHYVKGETLYVGVAHPVWMTELQATKKNLLDRLKELNLVQGINDIKFQLKKQV